MTNPNNAMHEMAGFAGSAVNKTGALGGATATDTVHVELAVAGWYKLSADVDFYWTGPGASADIAVGEARHEWGKDTPQEVEVKAGQFINILRVGAVAGVYFVNKVKGA